MYTIAHTVCLLLLEDTSNDMEKLTCAFKNAPKMYQARTHACTCMSGI
jgi:hypothetical protein